MFLSIHDQWLISREHMVLLLEPQRLRQNQIGFGDLVRHKKVTGMEGKQIV